MACVPTIVMGVMMCLVVMVCSGESEANDNELCLEPPPDKDCGAQQTLWYYDSLAKACRTFTYGGCFGNNLFDTKEECDESCSAENAYDWEEWTAWTDCSVTCGFGMKTQSRICSSPGDECRGSKTQMTDCYLQACCDRGSYHKTCTWEEWSPCSRSCGGGKRIRKRVCMTLTECGDTLEENDGIIDYCNNNICGEMTARLVNGTSESGRLEIYFNGEWSTVCESGFGKQHALVVCRMLGFSSTGAAVVSSAKYGAGTGRILPQNLQCVGTETSLAQCEDLDYGYVCIHQQDIGVMCNIERMKARLVNGTSEAGRLEIFFNGEWSTVCDAGFDRPDALVACRMLGFNRIGVAAGKSAQFGAGTGTILFDNLQCVGTETSLALCQLENYYNNFCSHQQDVGVICSLDEEMRVRLVNGTSGAGRLQISFKKNWSTVCGDFFGKEEALVTCRMLGFNSTAVAAVSSAKYGPGAGNILLDNMECEGTEPSLAHCQRGPSYCDIRSHQRDVGVICYTGHEMKARLVNGTSEAGRLEIFFNGEWSTVCDVGFHKQNALVACRLLGFNSSTGAVAVSSAMYGEGTGTILFENLRCVGTETSLAQCQHGPYYSYSCSHQQDVGVMCNIGEEVSARLANGILKAGRLEIFFNGEWSTVCDASLDKKIAVVACRMLGFNSTNVAAIGSYRYGPGTGRILLHSLQCVGTETSLAQCQYEPYYSRSCSHVLDVGVICDIGKGMRARLANGTSNSGRLEIFYNGEWSTVCNNGFRKGEALVACKMLGFNSTDVATVSPRRYGEGTGIVLFDYLRCKGTETSLAHCEHGPYYRNFCRHMNRVGVMCNIDEKMTARLVNGTSKIGRLEIFFNGEWSTVCDDSFGNEEAAVACRMLGFNGTGVQAVTSSKFGEGTGNILFDRLTCKGTETSLGQCEHDQQYYSHSCSHDSDVGVICDRTSSIYVASENTYPLLEGVRSVLECRSLRMLQQEAEYTWPETAGGFAFRQNLIFDNPMSAHHGRPVRCVASYMSNGRRHDASSDVLELQVYYYPNIKMTRSDNPSIPLAEYSNHTQVTPGHDVTFGCEADSNPPPASITWSGSVNSSTGDLQILAADQAVHGGVYTCTVVTGTDPGDHRLPLTSSRQIAVVVTDRILREAAILLFAWRGTAAE